MKKELMDLLKVRKEVVDKVLKFDECFPIYVDKLDNIDKELLKYDDDEVIEGFKIVFGMNLLKVEEITRN